MFRMEAKLNKAREYAWKAFVPLSIGAVVYLVVSFALITYLRDNILIEHIGFKNSWNSKLQISTICSIGIPNQTSDTQE